jgi:hypothetical protein
VGLGIGTDDTDYEATKSADGQSQGATKYKDFDAGFRAAERLKRPREG